MTKNSNNANIHSLLSEHEARLSVMESRLNNHEQQCSERYLNIQRELTEIKDAVKGLNLNKLVLLLGSTIAICVSAIAIYSTVTKLIH